MLAKMEAYVGVVEHAFAEAGTDCDKLRADLTAVKTDAYLASMRTFSVEMSPYLSRCGAHLDKFGSALQAPNKLRFEKLLSDSVAAGDRCATAPGVQGAIMSAMRPFTKTL